MKLLFFRSGSMCFQFGISTFFVALYMLTAAIISADNLFFSGNCPREDLNTYRYIYSVFSTLCKWGSWGWSIVGLTQCKYIQLFIYIQLFYLYTVPYIFGIFSVEKQNAYYEGIKVHSRGIHAGVQYHAYRYLMAFWIRIRNTDPNPGFEKNIKTIVKTTKIISKLEDIFLFCSFWHQTKVLFFTIHHL